MLRSFNGKTPRVHPTAFVSEAAYVVGDVEIGPYSSVWPGAVVIRWVFFRCNFGIIFNFFLRHYLKCFCIR